MPYGAEGPVTQPKLVADRIEAETKQVSIMNGFQFKVDGQPVPKAIPAHWINNRWSQNWTGFVKAVDFDPHFKGWQPERIVKTTEAFYTGLGFDPLPATFWTKSDLYPVKAGETRKKNSHASCWHLDLGTDIRSLMSVQPNMEWFETTHHELGHGLQVPDARSHRQEDPPPGSPRHDGILQAPHDLARKGEQGPLDRLELIHHGDTEGTEKTTENDFRIFQ